MEKWTIDQYNSRIDELKKEANQKMWLYIELNAKDFMNECEPGARNLSSCCKSMLNNMLEGDQFIVEPKIRTKIAGALTVRYYVDNLSPERRTYKEALNAAA